MVDISGPIGFAPPIIYITSRCSSKVKIPEGPEMNFDFIEKYQWIKPTDKLGIGKLFYTLRRKSNKTQNSP